MSVGHNTVSGEQLRSYVERIERLRVDQKANAEDIKVVLQEAASTGFIPKGIKRVVKIREMKPHDYQDEKAIEETYLHALGMTVEPPLFRAAGLAEFDPMVRENVVGAMKAFVPAFGKGDIIVTWGGKKLRLLRDKDGEVHEQDVVEAPPAARGRAPEPTSRAPKADVPDVDVEGAKALGSQYAKDNKPIIENPFPFGNPNRAHFDEGWRTGAGNDGFGPGEP